MTLRLEWRASRHHRVEESSQEVEQAVEEFCVVFDEELAEADVVGHEGIAE